MASRDDCEQREEFFVLKLLWTIKSVSHSMLTDYTYLSCARNDLEVN
jgi:hypothetical protein